MQVNRAVCTERASWHLALRCIERRGRPTRVDIGRRQRFDIVFHLQLKSRAKELLVERFSMPFKVDRRLSFGGHRYVIRHVDAGTNRLEIEDVETKVRRSELITDMFSLLSKSELQLFDKAGVQLDLSEFSADVQTLSPSKLERFYLRAAFARHLDTLGNLGPGQQEFIDAVAKLNLEHGSSVKPSTAYNWRLKYQHERTTRALARPRTGPTKSASERMHPLTREALNEVLTQHTKRVEERMKDQSRKFAIRGRTHLSIRAIAVLARAKVEELHLAKHVKENKERVERGEMPLPLPRPPSGPSNRTVQQEIYATQSRWRLLASVYGQHVARRRLGPHGPSFRLTRICERWETDVFIADVIVSIYYQGVLVPVGVPFITAMIDAYAGVIVGAIIEFRPPNYQTFLALLKQSFSPKDWLFARYPGIKHPFSAFGVCEVIGFDNAGMFSKEDVMHAQAAFNIILDPSSPLTPNDKPFIESAGAAMGIQFFRYQPANRKSIAQSRALEYSALKNPPMPMEVFAQKFWLWVWNIFHEVPMDDRQGWSRGQTWNHSLQSLALSDDPAALFPLNQQTLDLEVSVRHELRYTDEGFTIDNRHYRSVEMHELAMRFGAKFKFDVREDVSNPERVFAVLKELGRVVTVPVASELPVGLTSNAFHDLREAKAAMANPRLQSLAQSILEGQDGWRPRRDTTFVANSRDGLAVLLARHPELAAAAGRQASSTEGSAPQEKSPGNELRNAFAAYFSDPGHQS